MKKLYWLIFLIIAACGQSPAQLFETAELELLQTNYPHATELFQEIITNHPDSSFAETARLRIREIKARQEGPVE